MNLLNAKYETGMDQPIFIFMPCSILGAFGWALNSQLRLPKNKMPDRNVAIR